MEFEARPEKCWECGGDVVLVNGRTAYSDKRKVCPNCLARKMDCIQGITENDNWIIKSFGGQPPLTKENV